MDDDETQQFCLRWHYHQSSVIGALGRMFTSGALTDVTLSAGGTSLKAHRLVLASCSQYFAQLFKDVEPDNTLVVVLGCEPTELTLLLAFMYTGEVTASKKNLPSLLRLAQTLKVSGLTDADTNPVATYTESEDNETSSPINLDTKTDFENPTSTTINPKVFDEVPNEVEKQDFVMDRSEKERLSKLDQIVQNLYSTHKIGQSLAGPVTPPITPNLTEAPAPYERKWRVNAAICNICNKRLSNQYNLRVHMETHAGRRHACRACNHVSRSRDALRKHVAYRHASAKDLRTDL